MDEGEAGQGAEVEEEVGDCGEVGDVEVDEGEGAEGLRGGEAGEVGEAAVGDAFKVLEAEGLEGWQILKDYVVKVVHVEVGDAEVLEGGELVQGGGEDVALEDAALVGVEEEGCECIP